MKSDLVQRLFMAAGAAAVGLLLAGCPSQQSYLASKPPAFAAGYEDGCKSGEQYFENSLKPKIVDKARYRSDRLYRDGWDEGYNACYSQKQVEIEMERAGRRF
ncbi:hypothetical protein [Hydrogenimonas sp.]